MTVRTWTVDLIYFLQIRIVHAEEKNKKKESYISYNVKSIDLKNSSNIENSTFAITFFFDEIFIRPKELNVCYFIWPKMIQDSNFTLLNMLFHPLVQNTTNYICFMIKLFLTGLSQKFVGPKAQGSQTQSPILRIGWKVQTIIHFSYK